MDCIKTKRWLNGKGIDFERCALDTYKQNSIAEAVEKTIIAKAKAMRLLKRLPHILWREIIGATVYLYNKTPRQSLDWRTLYEVFQKHIISAQRIIDPRNPILHHLKAYTCKVYVLIKSKGDLDKPGRL